MTAWQFGELPMFRAGVIYADPPWEFVTRSGKGHGKSPQLHYDVMALDAIKALRVGDLAGPDCVLWMWATAPLLDGAMDTLKAWGFRFCSAGAWGKRSSTGRLWNMGPGYRLRSTAEFWLLGTIGEPEQRWKGLRNFVEAPVREHSRKPDMYDKIERAWRGPYVELFARNTRPGWLSWGNEVNKFDGAQDGRATAAGAAGGGGRGAADGGGRDGSVAAVDEGRRRRRTGDDRAAGKARTAGRAAGGELRGGDVRGTGGAADEPFRIGLFGGAAASGGGVAHEDRSHVAGTAVAGGASLHGGEWSGEADHPAF